jgi:hypothetical protein
MATVVGVFKHYTQGRGALDALRHEGFGLDELGLVANDGDLTDQVSVMAEADVADRGLFDVLVDMGVPRARAERYARLLADSRTIVTVAAPAEPRARQAARVLRRCGVRELSA